MTNEATPFAESGRLPPQNIEAEESVLGGVLLDNAALDKIGFLSPEDFYRSKHSRVYEAMQSLWQSGEPIDLVTLAGELKRAGALEAVGGQPFLTHLAGRVPTAANIRHYAGIVLDKAVLRSGIDIGAEISQTVYSPASKPSDLTSILANRLASLQMRSSSPSHVGMDQAVKESLRFLNSDDATSIATGFRAIDRYIHGLFMGEFTVIAAPEETGKTALLLAIILNMAAAGVPVLFFSIEMERLQVMWRFLSILSGVELRKIRSRKLTDAEAARLTDAAARLRELPITIDDHAHTTESLVQKADALRRESESPVGLVAVDYLQLLDPGGRSGIDDRVGQVAKKINNIKKSTGWHVIALASMNQDGKRREDPWPRNSDVYGSGAIKYCANNLWFLFRPQHHWTDPDQVKGAAKALHERELQRGRIPQNWFFNTTLIQRKGRDSGHFLASLVFQPQLTRFLDPMTEEQPQQQTAF